MTVTGSRYRQPLPAHQVAFSSTEGRSLFTEALAAQRLESFFPLIEQFHTQAEPAYCGLGSLVMALNALGVDPGRIWKGPWRWFSEELLDCCVPLEGVKQTGISLDEVACLARCNGADVAVTRPSPGGLTELRAALRSATERSDRVLIVSYDRATVGQTGTGHFSPIGGYHEGRDLALILDVARFKYPPHWMPVASLLEAMLANDPTTGMSRGWIELRRRTRPSAVARILRCAEGAAIGGLVRQLVQDTLTAVRAEKPSSVAALCGLVDRCLLRSGIAEHFEFRPPDTEEGRAEFAELLEQARRLPLHAIALAGIGAERATLTSLWLVVLAPRLSAPLQAIPGAASLLVDVATPDSLLGDEIALLRSQVDFLVDLRSPRTAACGLPGGCGPSPTGRSASASPASTGSTCPTP